MSAISFPTKQLNSLSTPCYFYDMVVLEQTLATIKREVAAYKNYEVHYAVKANANPRILRAISAAGLGADCVSGGEIRAAIEAGFPGSKVVFAGVGKADWEIRLGLEHDICCFNVESVPELEVINQLAAEADKVARVAFRINPDVGAHTHANITTGLAENKFGISMRDMEYVIQLAKQMEHVHFVGLHFHIGSQILEMDDFGSGYANLNTVMRLPFSTIKLDRSLLFDICNDEKRAQFYQSVVETFRKMNYHIVSEGVETREEMELISRWGVDMIQGYYFSKPLPEKALISLMQTETMSASVNGEQSEKV